MQHQQKLPREQLLSGAVVARSERVSVDGGGGVASSSSSSSSAYDCSQWTAPKWEAYLLESLAHDIQNTSCGFSKLLDFHYRY